MTPDVLRRTAADGVAFALQAGAGAGARHSDDAYREAGAEIVSGAAELLAGADVVLKVAPPRALGGAEGGGSAEEGAHEADLLREGAVLLSFLRPHRAGPLLERLAERRVTALAVELIPRITRAQSMDALSSMSTLAGYKAALLGAVSLGKLYPLLMTAAGTLSPARVLVIGAGVAGLQAIATARRLGAVVEGYDIRAAVKEQVESLGASFVEWSEEEKAEFAAAREERETAGGYARELAEEEQARERELVRRHVTRADVVITTALVPGRDAPLILTEEMVRQMRPGSVIVDLAAEAGGNCALTEPGETVERHGVTIRAPLDLPATLPVHASQMLARNLAALLGLVVRDGAVAVDLEDEIVGACCVTHGGEVRFRP